jgi:hypothetical protein
MNFKNRKNLKTGNYLLVNLIVLFSLLLFLNLSNIFDLNVISSKLLFFSTSILLLFFLFIRYELSDKKNKYKKILTIAFITPVILQLVFVNILGVTIPAEYYQIINFIFYFSASFLVLINLKNIRIKKIKLDKWELIFLIVITCLFIYFGTQHLGQFMSVDEPKWVHNRVPQLYEAIRTQNWADTFINDKPGLLPSYLAGITNFFMDKSEYQSDPLNYETYLFYWRLPIVLFNAFLLPFIYFFTKKLLNKKYAIATTILIALNPVLIGISQIVNPDATLWAPTFLSFITFLLYLKDKDKKYIIYSGLFLGLALTSKFAAAVLYPTFLVIIYLDYLTTKSSPKTLLKTTASIFLLFSISSITYGILIPATWVDYRLIWTKTISFPLALLAIKYISLLLGLGIIEATLLKGHISNYIRKKINIKKIGILTLGTLNIIIFLLFLLDFLFDGKVFSSSPFTFIQENFNFYIYARTSFKVMLITSTLPLIIGFFFIVTTYLKKKFNFKKDEALIVLSSLFLNYFFLIGSSLGGIFTATRYQIILFPINALITSFFFIKIIKNFKISIIILTILSFIAIFNSKPFYYHYNNILAQNMGLKTTELWGYGGYELAQIMNELPNAEELTVWVDREGFKEFFVGTSYFRSINPYETDKYDIDYLVLTNRGEQLLTSRIRNYYLPGEGNLLDLYKKDAEYIFCIDGEESLIRDTTKRCVWVVDFDKEYVHDKE